MQGKLRPQDQLAELADGKGADGTEPKFVVAADDQIGDGVLDQRIRDDFREPDIRERPSGRDPLGRGVRGHPRQLITGLRLARLGEQFHEIGEYVALAVHDRLETQPSTSCIWSHRRGRVPFGPRWSLVNLPRDPPACRRRPRG